MSSVIVIPAYNPVGHVLYQALLAAELPFMIREGISDQTRVRGQLLTLALRSGAQRIIMIDADMAPTPQQIRDLATHERVDQHTAVSGIYPLKDRDRWAYDEATNRAGLGFCCVHRESLMRVRDSLGVVKGEEMEWTPFTMPTYYGGHYSGNDFAFWERLYEHGTFLSVDSRIKVAHRFMATFSEPDLTR